MDGLADVVDLPSALVQRHLPLADETDRRSLDGRVQGESLQVVLVMGFAAHLLPADGPPLVEMQFHRPDFLAPGQPAQIEQEHLLATDLTCKTTQKKSSHQFNISSNQIQVFIGGYK